MTLRKEISKLIFGDDFDFDDEVSNQWHQHQVDTIMSIVDRYWTSERREHEEEISELCAQQDRLRAEAIKQEELIDRITQEAHDHWRTVDKLLTKVEVLRAALTEITTASYIKDETDQLLQIRMRHIAGKALHATEPDGKGKP